MEPNRNLNASRVKALHYSRNDITSINTLDAGNKRFKSYTDSKTPEPKPQNFALPSIITSSTHSEMIDHASAYGSLPPIASKEMLINVDFTVEFDEKRPWKPVPKKQLEQKKKMTLDECNKISSSIVNTLKAINQNG